MRAKSWLSEWLDEEGFRSLAQVEKALRLHPVRRKLVRRAREVPRDVGYDSEDLSAPVVASTNVDLSGFTGCAAGACRIQAVDDLFRRVWHYFDQIVVSGPAAPALASALARDPDQGIREVLDATEVLLHIREAGLEPYLRYVDKPFFCVEHLIDHAHEAGLTRVLSAAEELGGELSQDYEVRYARYKKGEWQVHYTHPLLSTIITYWIPGNEGAAEEELAKICARRTATLMAAYLISDATTSRLIEAPLALAHEARADERLSSGAVGAKPTEGDVAFRIPMPVMSEVPVREIVALREDQGAAYDALRSSLRKAIKERLASDKSEDAEAIALEIANDVINPALIEIERKLTAANRVLTRKMSLNSGVSAVLTTVGLLANAPLVTGAGLAAGAASIQSAHKYIEDTENIKMSDMYFLWELQSLHGRH